MVNISVDNIMARDVLEHLPQAGELNNFCADTNALTIEAISSNNQEVLNRWLHDIKLLLNDTPNIPYDLGHTLYPPFVASSFTLTKKTPKLLAMLSADDVSRMDFLMEVMLYLGAFGSNDCNEFRTTMELHGEFSKTASANYRFSIVSPVIYAMIYFQDPDNKWHSLVNEKLLAFNIDTVLAKATNFGYSALVERWNTVIELPEFDKTLRAKDYLSYKSQNGSKETIYCDNFGMLSYGGQGCGINVPYSYKGTSAESLVYDYIKENGETSKKSAPVEMLLSVLNACFRKDKVIVSSIDENEDGFPEVYILDGTKSPMEGRPGMMFALKDDSPYPRMRSSTGFAQLEASMAISAIATMMILDGFFTKDQLMWKSAKAFDLSLCPSTYEIVNNGLQDLIYKLEHGYVSKAKGQYFIWNENDFWSWMYWKDFYNKNIRKD